MIPALFTRNKVKIATANSLESYLGVTIKSSSRMSAMEDEASDATATADATKQQAQGTQQGQATTQNNAQQSQATGTNQTSAPSQSTSDNEFITLFDQLKGDSYDQFINKLNSIMGNDQQFEVLKEGLSKIDLSNAVTQEGAVSVSQLIPTQSEIDASNSLIWFLNGKGSKDSPNEKNVVDSFNNLFASPTFNENPPIIFNGKYIIDGHHRWSQAYCANPENKIKVINFKFEGDPIDALKRFQLAIAVTTDKEKLPYSEAKEGLSLYTMGKEDLVKYVASNMSNLCLEELKKRVTSVKDFNTAVAYIVNNCLKLKNNNKPIDGAPKRILMPQVTPAAKQRAEQPMTSLEEVDEETFIERGEVELYFFLQEAVSNLLIDGRIFFSKDPDKAYDEFVECLSRSEVKALVLRELDRAEIFDELSAYRVLERRSHQTDVEARERSRALESMRDALIKARPDLADVIE